MTYQEENDKLVTSFLEHTFFRGWNPEQEGMENFNGLELYLNNKCNLNCTYCYLARYGRDLYPSEIQDDEKVLKNAEMLIDWLLEKRLAPKRLELFAGEPLVQPIGLRVLEMILEKFKDTPIRPKEIVIPTNYTFLLNENLTRRIEDLLKSSRDMGLPIFLSASLDGKYCEANRPFKGRKDEPRDDAYYEKVFAFNRKWRFMFHPMVYSKHIEDWKKNFLWFQEMLKKHDTPWHSIYLLEVRNKEWNEKQIAEFESFIGFLIKWAYNNPCKKNTNAFIQFLFRDGFNILRSPLSKVGRGLGCSIQSTVQLRVGDLGFTVCHRSSYAPFITAHFEVKDGKITGIKAKNPEMMIGVVSLGWGNQPMCEMCPLKYLCSLGCLGSQFETTGDLFSPIPTVCKLEHAKIRTMIKTYKELKILDHICSLISPEKAEALRHMEKLIN